MDNLFKSFSSLSEFKRRADDDYADRLSRQYTVIVLVTFASLVTTRQFVGKPISCWCPAQFTDSHRDYANTVCWVSNTYYLPTRDVLQEEIAVIDRQREMVSYYQWVPFILLTQAVMTILPCLLWRFLHRRSGINLTTIMDAAHVSSEGNYLEVREKAIRCIVSQMDRYLLAQRDYRIGVFARVRRLVARTCCLVGGRTQGNFLVACYLAIKLLYAANAVGQLFLLDTFLGIDYHMYGFRVIDKLIRGHNWDVAERFPRVTLCDFDIRHQSRVHNYVVQCVLTINLFNEKIFVFIWFWFVFVSVVAVANTIQWIFRVVYWPAQVRYARKQLRAFETGQREAGVLAKFTENYLRRDGMFIVRLISMNMGEIVAGEVLCGLWQSYGPERRGIVESKNSSQWASRDNCTEKDSLVQNGHHPRPEIV